jgi:hypothetical protein
MNAKQNLPSALQPRSRPFLASLQPTLTNYTSITERDTNHDIHKRRGGGGDNAVGVHKRWVQAAGTWDLGPNGRSS